MLKIAILHYAGPPVIGGVESTIFHHSVKLNERGFKVTVVAGRGEQFHSAIDFVKIPLLDSKNDEVLSLFNGYSKENFLDHLKHIKEKILSELTPVLQKIDVCIVHNAITLHKNLPLTAALKEITDRRMVKVVAWCHDFAWGDELYLSSMVEKYPWILLKQAWDHVHYVVVSEHREQLLKKIFSAPPEHIEVIPPGVDIVSRLKLEKETQRMMQQFDLYSAYPILLLPARITRRKNIEFAIRVIAELIKNFPRACLLISGPPGPHNPSNLSYLDSLEELCASLEVTSNVKFLYQWGKDNRPYEPSDKVMADLYQIADILLFPSLREGFGIPILEAGLARLPVFASDIPPVKESSQGNIFTFDLAKSPKQVSQMIHDFVINDSPLKLRKRVFQYYSWEKIISDKVIPLILEVAGHE